MKFRETTALQRIHKLSKRIRAVQGGTSSSKTISILLILIDKAQNDKVPTLTSVVSETLPHLKKGAIRDFLSILEGHGYYKEASWNRTDFVYTFETGSKLEFFSADQPGKVRGPRRDRLFINEANNVPHETFDQLEVRTREFIFLDWNPVSHFWFYDELLGRRDDIDHITLTYRDNEGLPHEIVTAIEQRRENKAWWRVYGEGQLGEAEGRIYTDWKLIDAVPHEAALHSRGMDFGYSNDPTAIVDVYKHDGGFIFDEVCYQKGLGNKQIADILNAQPQKTLTFADSSEPKSIDEIRSYGALILPAVKGQGSVLQGIQFVQGLRVSVTKRSVSLIKEFRSYLWAQDREGRYINEPAPGQNDHALDAIRYALSVRRPTESYEAERVLVRSAAMEEGWPVIG